MADPFFFEWWCSANWELQRSSNFWYHLCKGSLCNDFPRKIVSWSSTCWKQLAKDQIRVFQGVDIDMLCEFGWICVFLFVFKTSQRVVVFCLHVYMMVDLYAAASCFLAMECDSLIIHIVVIHIGMQYYIYIYSIFSHVKNHQAASGRHG